ncbi:MAG: hypothetical protein CM15mP74_03650 [Halieaceae bacterium]|nr:MAG: hypothetical protein CM15mP74_03650 [Halieaceae bacterium]
MDYSELSHALEFGWLTEIKDLSAPSIVAVSLPFSPFSAVVSWVRDSRGHIYSLGSGHLPAPVVVVYLKFG